MPDKFPSARPTARAIAPLRDFLHTEAAGGAVLVAATVVALIWANSPWQHGYHDLFGTEVSLRFGDHDLSMDLQHWINDALMAVFFFVVGLEIKRELTSGLLASRRDAMVPAVAALGGMLVPAAIYLAIAGTTEPRGWAVPMATDIALAVGVVAVAGERIPQNLRVFLLALAIVDDLGAIVVIALFYGDGLAPGWLMVAAGAIAATVVGRRMGIRQLAWYVLCGVVLWFGLHEAGVHATLAGVAMGLLAPSVPHLQPELVDAEDLLDIGTPDAAHATADLARSSVSVVEWLEHRLHGWVSFGIVPLFALANAGITVTSEIVGDALTSPVAAGIVAGLVVGKPLGIVLATRLLGGGEGTGLLRDASGRQRFAVAASAGIGFTVALFISELAFEDEARVAEAKLAILTASVLAATVGLAAAFGSRPRARPMDPIASGVTT